MQSRNGPNSCDTYLAHVAGGQPAAMTGCENYHGANATKYWIVLHYSF